MEEARQYSVVTRTGLLFAAMFLLWAGASPVQAADRHAEYYYPKPEKIEHYRPRTRTMPNVDRKRRIGFVTAMANKALSRPYAPEYAIFAKGAQAEKLIIVSTQTGKIEYDLSGARSVGDTHFRRKDYAGVAELGVEDQLTFFDLINLLGFQQITVSNGEAFTHQVILR